MLAFILVTLLFIDLSMTNDVNVGVHVIYYSTNIAGNIERLQQQLLAYML